jgi:hypothetical protein
MRYWRTLAATALASFALVWVWVATMPMAFMDPEYPSWLAKLILLDRCDLGEAIILGDSRAAADILPSLLPIKATNLAVGGGEAIEAYAALVRALACPVIPRLVIISLDPGHFANTDLFWERSVRFGFVGEDDIAALRAASLETGDYSVYAGRQADGIPALLRDALYRIRFPPLYFGSLVRGVGAMRWWHNRQTLDDTLAARGHYYFGTGAGSDAVALDGHLTEFRPRPILDHYFNRILALLASRGIEARFVAMPVNDATWREIRPEVRTAFLAYLSGYGYRYRLFHVDLDLMPHWPDRWFGDQFCHLNPEGAERFSRLLAQRLQAAPPRTQNEPQNGWLSETAPDASAKVMPSSKRGS